MTGDPIWVYEIIHFHIFITVLSFNILSAPHPSVCQLISLLLGSSYMKVALGSYLTTHWEWWCWLSPQLLQEIWPHCPLISKAQIGQTLVPRDASRHRSRRLLWQATGSLALVTEVLRFSLRISFLLVLVHGLHSLRYVSLLFHF